MLEMELSECEEILQEMDDEIESIMIDLSLNEKDAQGVLQARELERAAKAFYQEQNALALCVR